VNGDDDAAPGDREPGCRCRLSEALGRFVGELALDSKHLRRDRELALYGAE
jgi:hypothetical protein